MSIVIPATMPRSVCQTTPFTMKIMEYSMTMELSASQPTLTASPGKITG